MVKLTKRDLREINADPYGAVTEKIIDLIDAAVQLGNAKKRKETDGIINDYEANILLAAKDVILRHDANATGPTKKWRRP